MSKADYYRARHKELMDKAKQEESWPETLLTFGAFIAATVIWVTVLAMLMP